MSRRKGKKRSIMVKNPKTGLWVGIKRLKNGRMRIVAVGNTKREVLLKVKRARG